MLAAQVLQQIAANPGTNGYEISVRLGANAGTVQRLLTKEFARNGLVEFRPETAPGTRGAVSLRLTAMGVALIDLVRRVFGPPWGWRDDVAARIDGIEGALIWVGRDSKVFDRADVREGRFDWIRMVKLDPEPGLFFAAVREASRNWPLLEAVATRKLRSIALAATLDRIKVRGGVLAAFIT